MTKSSGTILDGDSRPEGRGAGMAPRNAASGDALPEERQVEILRRLSHHGRVVASELAALFVVSEDSIRRDLRELAARGLCRRVYGGALPVSPELPPVSLRRGLHIEAKLQLARKAASLVRAGQTILIDAGSTNSAIADALPERLDLTIVTTAPDIAQRLMDRQGFDILMIGGRIDKRAGSAVGIRAAHEIRAVRADLCFPGVCAIDPDTGIWDVDSEEALIKRALIESSGETALVVTTDKFGVTAAHHVATVDQIDHLVMEHDVEAALRTAFEAKSISVHLADAPP
jgi:DeoR/GlpR family transcriptional regulator of sugar metabolism